MKVQSLWGGLAGVDASDVRQDFFHAGGHSLAAVQLVALINDAFGVEYPVSWAFANSSIEKQAADLRGRTGVAMECRPILTFRSQGSLPPLYLVHPGQGGAEAYFELAAQLGPELPVYGVEHHNLYGGDRPDAR